MKYITTLLSVLLALAVSALVAVLILWLRPDDTDTAAASITHAVALNAHPVTSSATYNVTWHFVWGTSESDSAPPAGAHWSPPVLSTSTGEAYWKLGAAASDGLRELAETGDTSKLEGELGGSHTTMSSVATPAGSSSVVLTVPAGQTSLTAASMIAPSPAWFAGISGSSLAKGGTWKNRVVFFTPLYDAGTDGGTGFTSTDSPTDPVGVISVLNRSDIVTAGPIGYLVLDRVP